jgi:hypothetical protein
VRLPDLAARDLAVKAGRAERLRLILRHMGSATRGPLFTMNNPHAERPAVVGDVAGQYYQAALQRPRMRCGHCGKLRAAAVPNWIEQADRLPGNGQPMCCRIGHSCHWYAHDLSRPKSDFYLHVLHPPAWGTPLRDSRWLPAGAILPHAASAFPRQPRRTFRDGPRRPIGAGPRR